MEPKVNTDAPTRESALAYIKQNAKYADEATAYSKAAKKLDELAHTLANASRKFPFGTMAALGYEIGQVRIAKGTGLADVPDGSIGVVTKCGAGSFSVSCLTKKHLVSAEDEYRYVPADHEKWVDTGYGVEMHKHHTWSEKTYVGVLVPAHKRKMKPGPITETYLTSNNE